MIRELLVKNIAVPVAEKLRGWPVSRYLRELEKSQWWTTEQIESYQAAKLVELIEHAYSTVPYYKRIFDDRGLKPQDIRTLQDLTKLPIITKDEVRANFEEMVSNRYSKSDLVLASSSGSTGEPFRYYISQDEKARKWAQLYRLWGWAGYSMGDKYVNLVAGAHRAFKSNRFLVSIESALSGMLLLTANELYQANAKEFASRIAQFKPKMIRGYASSIHYLAQMMQEQSISLHVDSVCTTGETLFDFQREMIEKAFGCKLYDGYGGEGVVISGQCGHSSGHHLNSENMILEIVDADGNPCGPGVEGQVVITDLFRYSMPLIRYNIQDIAVLSGEKCACGRGLHMLGSIRGRLTDIGVTPSGKSIVVHFFTGMFMVMAPHVNAFQVVQEKPDLFVLNIVPGEDFESVRPIIMEKTSAYLGSDVRVELAVMEDIPTTSVGKRRLFISKCGLGVAGASIPDCAVQGDESIE